jgi:hypothetical protein
MVKVTDLYCDSFDLSRVDLRWKIDTVPGPRRDEDMHEIFNFEFYVLRAGDSPMGPYQQIAGPFLDTYSFRDVQVNLLHKWRQYYYKLRVVDRRTQESVEVGPAATGEAPPDLIAAEIIRLEDTLFREFVGRRCWLYAARTFGPRCSCFDATMNRIMRSNHAPCFGTGYLGGYMSPVEVFVQIDPNPKQDGMAVIPIQPGDAMGRMISFPPANPNDILVESDNRRWRIMNVRSTQRLRATVRQEMQLHEIPRGDIEYLLPVQMPVGSRTDSAPRNFTNPQNVSKTDDVTDLLTAYGHPLGTIR